MSIGQGFGTFPHPMINNWAFKNTFSRVRYPWEMGLNASCIQWLNIPEFLLIRKGWGRGKTI